MGRALLITLTVLHGCDVGTTAVALSRGGIERNPLLPQSIGWNVAIQSGEVAATAYGLHRLQRSHPKAAGWLLVAGVVLEGYAVAHNARTLSTQRGQ